MVQLLGSTDSPVVQEAGSVPRGKHLRLDLPVLALPGGLDSPVLASLKSHDSLVLAPPGSDDSPVLASPGSQLYMTITL